MCHRLANGILGDERDGGGVRQRHVYDRLAEHTHPASGALPGVSRGDNALARDRHAARTACGKARRGEGECALEELSECLASGEDVQAAVAARELAAAIDRFLDTLKAADRDMFVCRYWLCAPVAEIARRMGATESRVKSSLMRSRNKLRAYLEEEGYI